ncbi:subtilisin family serine protease [Litorivivens lipolytica]|uniref:Subtilisin family serine protease n=1 Tax=Litorivivens lipolytica TaxID=1524264 RepID=A0A7W4W2M4_9GAMM|nr:S8 family peptidase [Litorivivens lipolytica]MBB3046316.1 subtilisin family serine protease [Litorivivens lipolytica]
MNTIKTRKSATLGLALFCISLAGGATAGLFDTVEKAAKPATQALEKVTPSGGKILQVSDALPHRYIIVLKDGVNVEPAMKTLMSTFGGQADLSFTSVLNGFAAYLTSTQAKALSLDKTVRYVEQDAIARISKKTVQQGATWGLDRLDQRDLPLDKQFSYTLTGSNTHTYIVDTGIRSDHKDFAGRLGKGVNTSDDPKQPPAGLLDPIFAALFGEKEKPDDPTNDCNGHGTHVAGTAGGTEWGVAKNTTLYAVRVLNCEGAGSNSTVIAGLDWIAKNAKRPAVVNMSLGGGASSAMDDAVNDLVSKGITVIVAAGNDDKDACQASPARAKKAITVAASDNRDRRAGFSNHGRCADLFAPGKDITSAWIDSNRSTKTISGTSMASPHVAGVAALMLEAEPDRSPAELEKALLKASVSGKIGDRKGSPDKLLQVIHN